VLIYGLYPNKEAALEASEAWSAKLAALPTWLRRMDSVQKQVKAQTVLSE
jgi:DamX protein